MSQDTGHGPGHGLSDACMLCLFCPPSSFLDELKKQAKQAKLQTDSQQQQQQQDFGSGSEDPELGEIPSSQDDRKKRKHSPIVWSELADKLPPPPAKQPKLQPAAANLLERVQDDLLQFKHSLEDMGIDSDAPAGRCLGGLLCPGYEGLLPYYYYYHITVLLLLLLSYAVLLLLLLLLFIYYYYCRAPRCTWGIGGS